MAKSTLKTRRGLSPPPGRPVAADSLRETLVVLEFADEAPVLAAELEARSTGRGLEAVLLERGVLDATTLERATAAHEGLAHVDLAAFAVDPEALALISPQDARGLGAQPVAFLESGAVLVVMADPRDEQALSGLTFLIPHPIERALVGRAALDALVDGRPEPAPAPFVALAAPSAIDQLQAVLQTVETEEERRLRTEHDATATRLRESLEAERTAHAATRLQLAETEAARAETAGRVEAALLVLAQESAPPA